jgi:hypothetical protein
MACMAQDPDLVRRYSEAHQAYSAAVSKAPRPDDPALIEAREEYRVTLAAYVLDLEVNGMSVPVGLAEELAQLTKDAGTPEASAQD